MPLLVTSASGAKGNGYGALLAFDQDGKPLGPFSDDERIVDPRGLQLKCPIWVDPPVGEPPGSGRSRVTMNVLFLAAR
jgi:hypothetical protein